MSHTPGPWQWKGEMLLGADGAEVLGPGPAGSESIEVYFMDARLIAAAPDLLEALIFARSVIQSGEPWTETCERVIDGAIAKARSG